jgi:putrescine transport system permease protein
MIGKTLWDVFNLNRDWPAASAVAVVLLIVLVVPIVYYQHIQAKQLEAGR